MQAILRITVILQVARQASSRCNIGSYDTINIDTVNVSTQFLGMLICHCYDGDLEFTFQCGDHAMATGADGGEAGVVGTHNEHNMLQRLCPFMTNLNNS